MMKFTPNPYPGKFVVFEGIDGSGKSLQSRLLATRLRERDVPVLETREPTPDGLFGKLVRSVYTRPAPETWLGPELTNFFASEEYRQLKLLTSGKTRRHLVRFEAIGGEIIAGNFVYLPLLLQLGMTFDGHDHVVRRIIPALGAGTAVISDRWRLSTPAYGAGEGLNWRMLLTMQYEVLGEHLIAPDLVVFLGVPPAVGLERTLAKQGGARERFDRLETLERIAEAYELILGAREVAQSIRIMKLDGARDPVDIHNEIWAAARPMLSTDAA